jgi:hypothetical protein
LELLSKLPDQFAVKIHGYVLMANHYHLQIETQNANLSDLGNTAGEVDYPAVSAALSRFEKRLKIDRELQRKLKATRVLLKI